MENEGERSLETSLETWSRVVMMEEEVVEHEIYGVRMGGFGLCVITRVVGVLISTR
jgi:hypothetical protein